MSKTIFEHSTPGRKGVVLPEREIDIPLATMFSETMLRTKKARLPEVSELDTMRHYITLSHKNHFIEKGLYPLGSCTMKY
ncbi:MAG TPA: aminomethyl-transferring glycine dehydrogenase subunit GcvPB, partial [Candidatus Cloacimonas sp.]|nr:aminomethyl-transferring glycine dehydrogenase subunit GcvPB [Candidatus Cloacimonas sp.]